jgi:hypothetical protein
MSAVPPIDEFVRCRTLLPLPDREALAEPSVQDRPVHATQLSHSGIIIRVPHGRGSRLQAQPRTACASCQTVADEVAGVH